METQDNIVEQFKKEEHALLLRLRAIQGALDAYVLGKLRQQPADASPGSNRAHSGPTLDGMRIPDAIRIYMNWAKDQGRMQVPLGELADHLSTQRIMSAM